MTTDTSTTTGDSGDLELWDDAKAEFANKFDLKDRLCLIWVTGKHGTRRGENGTYDWYETYTLVLDDPNGTTGWDGMVFDGDKREQRESLVPSVSVAGPVLLENFQFSYSGAVARLRPRVDDTGATVTSGAEKTVNGKPKNFRPMLGRINSRPNSKKGMAPPFGIAEPTPEDKAVAAKYRDKIAEVSKMVEAKVTGSGADGDSAFD
jgi:hypothetical protein